jgi:NhaP-type Na+/H+ or K+/H+ antiporter
MNTKSKVNDALICAGLFATVNAPVSAGNAMLGHVVINSERHDNHDIALLIASAAVAGTAAGISSGLILSYLYQSFNLRPLLSRTTATKHGSVSRTLGVFGIVEMLTFVYMIAIHAALQEPSPNGKLERAGEFAVGTLFSTMLFSLCTITVSCCARTQRQFTRTRDNLNVLQKRELDEITPMIDRGQN